MAKDLPNDVGGRCYRSIRLLLSLKFGTSEPYLRKSAWRSQAHLYLNLRRVAVTQLANTSTAI
jgi:hypothetical protein